MKSDKLLITAVILSLFCSTSICAEDSELSRRTLAGLRRVYVLVEYIQPNIQKYSQRAGLGTEQLQKDIALSLHAAGIRTMSREKWLNERGRPVLYININTHETGKYWYAYDIKIELRQIVNLEVNPKIKTLADTWSINITGMANIGNLNTIKKDVFVLLERFLQAHRSVNKGG